MEPPFLDFFSTGSSSKGLLLEYGNEEPAFFIAGLAGNIGLEAEKAATMTIAAVAARTRAGFIQAWVCVHTTKNSKNSLYHFLFLLSKWSALEIMVGIPFNSRFWESSKEMVREMVIWRVAHCTMSFLWHVDRHCICKANKQKWMKSYER